MMLAGVLSGSLYAAPDAHLSRIGSMPYKPRWVSILKKGRFFKYKRKEYSSPRIRGERIYVGADAGFIFAIEKKNGHRNWRFKTSGSVNTTPAFSDNQFSLGHSAMIIFQGPVADAFTHVGQLAMLRGHAGSAVRPESFARAEIARGRVGLDQSTNRREFDGDASKKK